MREIKFRAWLKEKKVMAGYVSHLKHAPDCGVFEITIPFDESGENTFRKLHHINEFELMQFTGLLDKNGKEIYEGDIYKYNGGHLDKVEWIIAKDGSSGFKLWSNAEAVYKDIEVIGNVWENPELLENKVTI